MHKKWCMQHNVNLHLTLDHYLKFHYGLVLDNLSRLIASALNKCTKGRASRRVWLNCCRLRRCGSTFPEGVVFSHVVPRGIYTRSFEEVSRHCQSYLQRSTTRKMTGKYHYTTIARK